MNKRVVALILSTTLIVSLMLGGDGTANLVSYAEDEPVNQAEIDNGANEVRDATNENNEENNFEDENTEENLENSEEIIMEAVCPHSIHPGDSCHECGKLVHSSKNIPLIGFSLESFADLIPPDDASEEDLILYNMRQARLACTHNTADGLYCEQCGEVVDIQPDDDFLVIIVDACIHGRIQGEKCDDCKALREDQEDYEPSEDEDLDDPLIYGTGTTDTVNMPRPQWDYKCPWCNSSTSWSPNTQARCSTCGKYGYPSKAVASGNPCGRHTHTLYLTCGHSSYTQQRTASHSYDSSWSYETTKAATCQSTGTRRAYKTCTKCSNKSYGSTNTLSKLSHKVNSYTYTSETQHTPYCSGNGTSRHAMPVENHSFTLQSNKEDYLCSKNGCGARQTTVHVDAYMKTADGETLLRSNVLTKVIPVGNNSATTFDLNTVFNSIPQRVQGRQYIADQDKSSWVQSVASGGMHFKVYYDENEVDIPAYPVSISVDGAKEKYIPGDSYKAGGILTVTYSDGSTQNTPLQESYIKSGTFPISDTAPYGTKSINVVYQGLTPSGQSVDTTALGNTDVRYWLGPDYDCTGVEFSYTLDGVKHTQNLSNPSPTLANILKYKVDVAGYKASLSPKDGSIIVTQTSTGRRVPFVPESTFAKDLSEAIILKYGHSDLCCDYNIEIVDKSSLIRVMAPKIIVCKIDKDGNATLQDTYQLMNVGYKAAGVTKLSVETLDDWTLVPFNSDASTFESGNNIAIKINGCEVSTDGTVDVADNLVTLAASTNTILEIEIKASKQSTEFKGQAFKIKYTIEAKG